MKFHYLFLSIIILVSACKKNKTPETVSTLAVIEFSALRDFTYNTANILCTIKSEGSDPVTEKGICWDTLPDVTTSSNKVIALTNTADFSCQLLNLKRKTYFIRVYAVSAAGTAYSKEFRITPPRGWISVTNEPPGQVSCVELRGAELFAGTEQDGLYSMDVGSEIWTKDTLDAKQIHSLIMADGGGLYTATSNGIFYRSGFDWIPINSGLETMNVKKLVEYITFKFALESDNVYTLRSNYTWEKLKFNSTIKAENIWTYSEGVIIFDKTAGKLYSSDAIGNTSFLCNAPSSDILTVKSYNTLTYLGTSDGAFVSSNKSLNWIRISDTNVNGQAVSCFLDDEAGLCATVGNEVYRVTTQGPWLKLCPGLPQNFSLTKFMTGYWPLYVYTTKGTSGKFYRRD